MNSPNRQAVISKKKYSGALFLEHDEFDCFAEQNQDDSSEETKTRKIEMIKSLSRRESSHLGLSAGSRKFSKKIEEVANEEKDINKDHMPARTLSQKNPINDQAKYPHSLYTMSPPPYADLSKTFFPAAITKMGMNSIPSIPYTNQAPQNQATYQYNQSYYSSKTLFSSKEASDGEGFYGMSDEDIMNHFSEFVENQSNCKLIQNRVEEKPYFFDMIFQHVTNSNFAEFCMDPSTTFLATKLVDLSAHENDKLLKIVACLKGRVLQLCSDHCGTRVLQRLIEKIYNKPEIFEILASEIKDNVCMLVMCNNGNHVIQKIIAQSKCASVSWVYDEILGKFKALGMHKHGCCVIQRCLDNANPYYKVVTLDQDRLIGAVIENAVILVGDMYGNYIVQYVIEKPCKIEFKRQISEK